MSACAEHDFRVVREEWTERTTYLRDGMLVEGPEIDGACTDQTISCDACGYTPELTQVVDEASGELVWVGAPADADEDARLRAAGVTVQERT